MPILLTSALCSDQSRPFADCHPIDPERNLPRLTSLDNTAWAAGLPYPSHAITLPSFNNALGLWVLPDPTKLISFQRPTLIPIDEIVVHSYRLPPIWFARHPKSSAPDDHVLPPLIAEVDEDCEYFGDIDDCEYQYDSDNDNDTVYSTDSEFGLSMTPSTLVADGSEST